MFLELKNLQQCKIHNLILFKLKPNLKKDKYLYPIS